MNMKIMQVVADIHAWDDFDLFWRIPAWIWLLIWNFEISMSKKTVKKATTLDFDVQIPFLFLHMDFILHLAYFCWTNMQGSSDLSVLTETGVQQAEKCRRALANINFDRCFASPISRAKSTAEVLWQGRAEELVFLDSLKEAHLFFLEGMKNEIMIRIWRQWMLRRFIQRSTQRGEKILLNFA